MPAYIAIFGAKNNDGGVSLDGTLITSDNDDTALLLAVTEYNRQYAQEDGYQINAARVIEVSKQDLLEVSERARDGGEVYKDL